MGIFESNYSRIARNTAKYYFELKRNYGERFDNEISILATSGLLDTAAYVISEQSITVSTLLHLANISLKNPLDIKSTKNIELISFIYWLEVEIFRIDTKLPLYEIQETVMSQLNKIEKTVLKVQAEYSGDSKTKLNAQVLMLGDEGISYRRKLGIKEISKKENFDIKIKKKNSQKRREGKENQQENLMLQVIVQFVVVFKWFRTNALILEII